MCVLTDIYRDSRDDSTVGFAQFCIVDVISSAARTYRPMDAARLPVHGYHGIRGWLE